MKQIIHFLATIIFVVIFSIISASMWGGKPETLPENFNLTINKEMTVSQFVEKNNLEKPFVKELLGLQSRDDLQKNILEFGSEEQLMAKYKKTLAIATEHETKNWFKIPLKFATWLVMLVSVFLLLKSGKVTKSNRKWIYAISFTIFGVILGADPSPMGTVKDAIYLYGKAGAIFPPRMVALTIFLLTVLLANKFICSWGCQFGTLQDFIFRLNGDSKNNRLPQFKPSFAISNSIRVFIFIAMCFTAIVYATDFFSLIDPFKIFKPKMLGMVGTGFVGALLILSLFTYRPWCLFFCPFGLVGWLVEKVSIFNIKVNYDTCISCNKCSNECPSTVMDAILKQDKKVIPDCFSCGICVEVCPTNSVNFKAGKRTQVPEGKFTS
ncbi:MAG: 4Fe-4S ferredoxin [Denitrovibrio sp.]|nr:MAG: 4Fe-4S ferredoxin [Denitrovibrio sp.]